MSAEHTSNQQNKSEYRFSRRFRSALEQWFGKSASLLRRILPGPVRAVVVTGSGMSTLLRDTAVPVASYAELPDFPQPTVAGHAGIVKYAQVEGLSLLVCTGRIHVYEGAAMPDILAPVALAALLGARAALLLNSAGGLQAGWETGDIMLIADSANMMFRSARRDWLYATPLSYRHPPTYFDESWRRSTGCELTRRGVRFREGTYIGVTGPCYETPAEVRCYRRMGGQAIGMSTVHEAEFAHACGMNVAGCSLISNTLHETATAALSHEEVLEAAQLGRMAVEKWIHACCRSLPELRAPLPRPHPVEPVSAGNCTR